jgi:hypothetical protein
VLLNEADTASVEIVLSDPVHTPRGLLFDQIWISSYRPVVTACPPSNVATHNDCHVGHQYPVQSAEDETIPAMEGMAVSKAGAQQLPKVWVGGPNLPPCYRVSQVHGKSAEEKGRMLRGPTAHHRGERGRQRLPL